MKILIVTPAPPRSRKGNRITALRWSRLLRELGHRVTIAQKFTGQPCDLLIALHARRSALSVRRFCRERSGAPLILALTGTDLYGDIHHNRLAQESLELATRLVLLQAHGLGQLPQPIQSKARVIYQSVERPKRLPAASQERFRVCVVGHLRPVKAPLDTARAARRLPPHSKIEVIHMGAALSAEMQRRAHAEERTNPRYRWLGELPRWQVYRHLARSRLLVLTSKMEGGANAISEAMAIGLPVLSSRISGSMGLLGDDYPGYFPVGDIRRLAELLRCAEENAAFYRTLCQWCARRAPLIEPSGERRRWQQLLAELE